MRSIQFSHTVCSINNYIYKESTRLITDWVSVTITSSAFCVFLPVYVSVLTYGYKLCFVTGRASTGSSTGLLCLLSTKISKIWDSLEVEPLILHEKCFGNLTKLPPGLILQELYQGCPTRLGPQGRARTCWRDHTIGLGTFGDPTGRVCG